MVDKAVQVVFCASAPTLGEIVVCIYVVVGSPRSWENRPGLWKNPPGRRCLAALTRSWGTGLACDVVDPVAGEA